MRSDLMICRVGTVLGIAAICMAAGCAITSSHPLKADGSGNDPWMTVWAASLQRQRTGAAVVSGQTIRQSVLLSAGGQRIRLRFSNEFGAQRLIVGSASVKAGTAGAVRVLTFGGSRSAVVPPGAPLLSDPIDLKTEPLQELQVNLFLPESTPIETYQRLPKAEGAVISPPGDFTGRDAMPRSSETYPSFLSAIETSGGRIASGLVIFGDTKSAGPGTWPESFASSSHGKIAVANRSQWAGSLTLGQPGESGSARFDREVLTVEGGAEVLIFIGNNDLIQPGTVGSDGRVLVDPSLALNKDQLIEALRQVAVRVHAHGMKAIGATWLPYEGVTIPGYATAEKLATRDAINAWIRSDPVFDQVIDFDAALRDPMQPERLQAAYDSGNHFTPSDAGYRRMADVALAALAGRR